MIAPNTLSEQLRREEETGLRDRRAITCLSMAAAGCMRLITAYQMGIIRRLPDLPLPGFDAETVDASEEAYAHLEMPDAAIGLTSYAVTTALATAGPADRAHTPGRSWLPWVLLGKICVDSVQAARLTRDQWTRHRSFCVWCLIAAAATWACLPFAAREARDTLHSPEPMYRRPIGRLREMVGL